LFRFSDSRIAESSALAASSFDDGVFTANDSGDSARFFKADARGDTVATYTLRGATNIDWEDMATGTDTSGRPVLYFADIGDNSLQRKEIEVYQTPEPSGGSADVAWIRYRFTYPDGAHDAEALLVDPRTRRMYIATKSLFGGELYAAPETLTATAVNMLSPVRTVPALTTSADFSPDGSRIVVLTYLGAYWADDISGALHSFKVPLQSQAEAIAFSRDGASVLVGSEGLHSTVYRVALPAAATEAAATAAATTAPASAVASAPATSTTSALPTPEGESPTPEGGSPTPGSTPLPAWVVAVAASALAVFVLLALWSWRRRRSRHGGAA